MTEKLSQFTASTPTSGTYIAGADLGSPNRKFLVSDINAATLTPGSIPVTGNINFYVDVVAGSDSNNGLAPGAAFKTINHAMAIVNLYNWIPDPSNPNFGPIINVANGTYNEQVEFSNLTPFGIPLGNLIGNPSSPSSVVINGGSGNAIGGFGYGNWQIDGFRLQGRRCINVVNEFTLNSDDLVCDVSFIGFRVNFAGGLEFGFAGGPSGITINAVGTAQSALFSMTHQGFVLDDGGTKTFSGPINFSNAVFSISNGANCQFGISVTGGSNVTGQRYSMGNYAVLDWQGGGNRSNIIGSTVGSIDETSIILVDPLYQLTTPTSGSTVTATPGCHLLLLNPASYIQGLTLNLPTNMSDGEKFAIGASQTIIGMTLATTDGSTIKNNPGAFSLQWGQEIGFVFDTSANTWYVEDGGINKTLGSILAPTSLTFFVGTSGSDTNPGTSSSTFLTIQHAVNVAGTFDWTTGGFAPTISVGNGTYVVTEIDIVGASTMLSGTIIGNPSSPGSVIIAASGGAAAFHGVGVATWGVQGFRIQPTGQRAVKAENFFEFDLDDITVDVQSACYQTIRGARIFLGLQNGTNGQTFNAVSGATPNVLLETASLGSISYQGGPINFPGPITFSFTVAFIVGGSSLGFPPGNNVNVSGATNVTGSRYIVSGQSSYDLEQVSDRSHAIGSTVGSLSGYSIFQQDAAYQLSVPTSGGTVTVPPGCHQQICNPTAGLATLTVNLPTNMSDSETCSISTTKTITTLTIASTDGSTVVAPVTTLAASATTSMMYDSNTNSWYPSGAVLH